MRLNLPGPHADRSRNERLGEREASLPTLSPEESSSVRADAAGAEAVKLNGASAAPTVPMPVVSLAGPKVPPAPPVSEHLERVCLRSLLASATDAIYFKDRANRFIVVSRGVVRHHVERLIRAGRAEEAAGLVPEDFIGKTDVDLFDEALALAWMAEEERIIQTGQGFVDVLERDTTEEGSSGWYMTSKGPLVDDDGTVVGTFGITRDVTAQVTAEHEVRRREAQLRAVLDSSPDAIASYNLELRYELVNAKAAALVGKPSEELLGRTDAELGRPQEVVAALEEALARALDSWQMSEVEFRAGEGEARRWFQVRMVPHFGPDGEVSGIVAATRDLTELKEAQAALAHQAMHDPLTGAVNRVALMDRVRAALSGLSRDPGGVALVFIDLDNFKLINDARGHEVGDMLLVEVASRLSRVLRGTDTVARMGGDEFVLLFEHLAPGDDAYLLADRVLAALARPFSVAGEKLRLTASAGVAVTSNPSSDPGELLREADLAMYKAKEEGRDRIKVSEPKRSGQKTAARLACVEIGKAVQDGQFFLLYQPIFSLRSGSLCGVEALARWRHPTLGLVGPEEFVPLAEDLGLIDSLGLWVLGEACQQLARWEHPGNAGPYMAVNITARHLATPGFVEQVVAVTAGNGLAMDRLCLEVSEAGLLEEWGASRENLDALLATGARIALDDFGTGRSSIAHLHSFRAHTVKVDRSVVARVTKRPRDAAFVAGVVAAAHALRMEVVAEGVETAEQLAQVREMGCDQAQGMYLSEPLPAPEVGRFVGRGSPALPTG